MGNVRETYSGLDMAANASVDRGGSGMGGFLAKTSGTITVTEKSGTVVVNAVPVTAGAYTPMPLQFQQSGGFTVALSGGASGTLFV